MSNYIRNWDGIFSKTFVLEPPIVFLNNNNNNNNSEEIYFKIDNFYLVINYEHNNISFEFDDYAPDCDIFDTVISKLPSFINKGIFLFYFEDEFGKFHYIVTPNWWVKKEEVNVIIINNLFTEFLFGSPFVSPDLKEIMFKQIQDLKSGFFLGSIPINIIGEYPKLFTKIIDIINNATYYDIEKAIKLYFKFLKNKTWIPFKYREGLFLPLILFSEETDENLKWRFLYHLYDIKYLKMELHFKRRISKLLSFNFDKISYKEFEKFREYYFRDYKSDTVMFGEKIKNKLLKKQIQAIKELKDMEECS